MRVDWNVIEGRLKTIFYSSGIGIFFFFEKKWRDFLDRINYSRGLIETSSRRYFTVQSWISKFSKKNRKHPATESNIREDWNFVINDVWNSCVESFRIKIVESVAKFIVRRMINNDMKYFWEEMRNSVTGIVYSRWKIKALLEKLYSSKYSDINLFAIVFFARNCVVWNRRFYRKI